MSDNIFEILALVFTFILLCFILIGQSFEIKDLKHQINVMQNETELSCKSYCETEFEKMGC